MAHRDVEQGKLNSPWASKKMASGLAFLILGAVGAIIAFGMLDQSKQAPMGCLTLIYNCILAALVLKEPFTRIDLASMLMMIGGTIAAVLCSEKNSTKFKYREILDRLDDPIAIGYTSAMIPVLLLLTLRIDRLIKKGPEGWTKGDKRFFLIATAGVGGALSGYTAYFAKGLVTVFITKDFAQFKALWVYLWIIGVVGSVINQVRYLNLGLKYFDSLQVVPVYQSLIVLCGIVSGIVYFGDMRTQETGKVLGFVAGASTVVGGILLLISRKKSGQPAGDVSDDKKSLLGSPNGIDLQGITVDGKGDGPSIAGSLNAPPGAGGQDVRVGGEGSAGGSDMSDDDAHHVNGSEHHVARGGGGGPRARQGGNGASNGLGVGEEHGYSDDEEHDEGGGLLAAARK